MNLVERRLKMDCVGQAQGSGRSLESCSEDARQLFCARGCCTSRTPRTHRMRHRHWYKARRPCQTRSPQWGRSLKGPEVKRCPRRCSCMKAMGLCWSTADAAFDRALEPHTHKRIYNVTSKCTYEQTTRKRHKQTKLSHTKPNQNQTKTGQTPHVACASAGCASRSWPPKHRYFGRKIHGFRSLSGPSTHLPESEGTLCWVQNMS